jgi:hypothetical protein
MDIKPIRTEVDYDPGIPWKFLFGTQINALLASLGKREAIRSGENVPTPIRAKAGARAHGI